MVLYKYYFQIPVQKEAIRRLTGFIAFNTLWTWLRLSQDIHTAPGIAQFVIDWLFERCKTFRWIYGWCLNIQQSVDEHLNTDLPWCFAALSAYQCLLSPKKCEWLANSMRVLGHQIGVDYVDLPEPRTEEIRTLKFQNTKEALLSKLCFMSYFMHVNPKIFQHLASLRELTKRGGTLQANSTSWETIWRCQRSSIRSCLEDDTHSFLGCELWIFCHSRQQSQCCSGYVVTNTETSVWVLEKLQIYTWQRAVHRWLLLKNTVEYLSFLWIMVQRIPSSSGHR